MYFINKYDKSRVSFLKAIAKDLFFLTYYAYSFILNRGRVKTVLFYPDYPSKRAVLYKVFRLAGYNITNNPESRYIKSVFWSEKTIRDHDTVAIKLHSGAPMINYYFTDSSKVHVEKAFQTIFNDTTFVDPMQYNGSCVKKSNYNAVHDGVILKCPVSETDPESVYQIVVDNIVEGKYAEDMRIPVINYNIPFIYLKYKSVEKRFGTFKQSLTRGKKQKLIENPSALLNQDEIRKIIDFCRLINMEYGELDVLRDRKSKRIYIIDANNTPHGPTGFTKKDTKKALKMIAGNILSTPEKQFINEK
jgi:hypothetical protein